MNIANTAALVEQFNQVLGSVDTADIVEDAVLGKHCKAAVDSRAVVADLGDAAPIYVTDSEIIFFWMAVFVTLCKNEGVSMVLDMLPDDHKSDNYINELQSASLEDNALHLADFASPNPERFRRMWKSARKKDAIIILRPVIGFGMLVELRNITWRKGDELRTKHTNCWTHTEEDMQRPVDVSLLTHRLKTR